MNKRIILFLSLISFSFLGLSQNPKLNKYTFGEGLKFSGNNKSSVVISGYMQPSIEIKKYAADSNTDVYYRFRMRRLRFRISGDLPKYKLEYRFQTDFSGSSEVGDEANLALFDAYVIYKPSRNLQIKFGQSVPSTENLELTMNSNTLQLPERSRLTSAFAVPREFGIFISNEFKLSNNLFIKPTLSITNGDGANTFNRNYGGFKYGARLDVLPFGKFTNFGQFNQVDMVRELTPKLLLSAAYSMNEGMSSRRGESAGTILYLDSTMKESLPDYSKFGINFLFKYKGFSMIGEFMLSKATVPKDITTRVRADGTTANTFLVNGVQDVENYVKGRMMLGKGYNIQGGYILKNNVSIDARYTHLEADANSFMNNPTFYNRPNYYTLGLSKYLSRGYGFKIQGSITYADLAPGSLDLNAKRVNNHEWIGNIIATISF